METTLLCYTSTHIMMSIPHALTGAFIANTIPEPIIYAPTAFCMHFLEDWVPHWDVGTGLSTGKRKRSTAILLELVELSATVGLIWLFFQRGHETIQYHVWLGGLMGIMPDLLEAPHNFLKWEPKFLKPLSRIHQFFHNSTPNMTLGLAPQVILVWIIWVMR